VYWQLLCGEYDHEHMQIIDNQSNGTKKATTTTKCQKTGFMKCLTSL